MRAVLFILKLGLKILAVPVVLVELAADGDLFKVILRFPEADRKSVV